MALQIRRGTEATRTSITPAQGELIYTTDEKKLFVGDGTTAGGVAITATTASIRAAISAVDAGGDGSFTYNNSTGVFTYTGPSAEQVRAHITAGSGISITGGAVSSTITQYTDTLARQSVSVTDAGGDGSMSYNNSTGVLTYTGPSASEVRAHLSAGTGLTYSSGQFAIDGTVATKTYADNAATAAASAVIDAAPATLDTLNELAAALNDDANFATTITTSIGTKLATSDFTTTANTYLGTKTTDNLTEGTTNKYFSNTLARGAVSVTDSGGDGSLSYNNTTGVFTYTGPSATDVRAHFTASTGISITDGAISSTITQYTDSGARAAISVTDAGGDGSLSYNNTTGVFTYTGPSASDVRAHFSAGTGISITSGSIAVDTTTIATKTYADTAASAAASSAVAAVIDTAPGTLDTLNELAAALGDDANFATTITTSIGTKLATADFTTTANTYLGTKTTDNLTQGTTNKYFSDTLARGAFTASTGISITSGAISSTITQYTDALSRAAVSVTDSGGDGSLSYNNTTGVFTYTGPSATDVRAHFSAGSGITITDGVVANTQTQYTDTAARAAVSVTDSGGDGSLSYNNTTGVFTYTGPSASDVRAHFSAGTGITITSGAIATTITQYTDTLARAAVSVTDAGGDGSLSYNNTTGVFTYTGPSAAEVRAHISASTGISITDGAISSTITQYTDTAARTSVSVTDAGGDGSLSYNNTTGVFTYTGPSATDVRAHFTGGTGITITSGSIAVDTTTIATKTYADSAASAAVAAVIDTAPATLDTLNELAAALGDDANFSTTITTSIGTKLATADFTTTANTYLGTKTTDNLTEGTTNKYFSNTLARGAFSASTGISITSGAISSTITQYTDALSRAAISVTDSGGDGSLSYNNTTGVFTYTGPSAAEVRAHISASTGISITDGAISTTITQYTDTLARAAISVTDSGGDGSLSYNSTTGVFTYTGPSAAEVRAHISASTGISITDGAISSTITQYTDALSRAAVSVTDSGGDGSLSYNNTTGVFTYTGPSATDVRAHFSAGTGITITSGVIATTITDTNTTYGISAETVAGGVNLRLTGSDSSTDNVKLAEGSNITLTRTDADTITIAATASGVTSVSGTATRITSSGGATPIIDLATTAVTPATYGSASLIPVVTVDAYGRITGVTTASNPQGTVTSVGGTGTVNGLTLTGTVTSTGNLTLGGTLSLVSPPAIGSTSPNTGAFTTLSSTGTLTFKNPIETVYSLGTTGGTVAPDPANGSVQSITLNSALTLNAFTNPTAGESMTLIITGGTAYTSITSTMKFAGGDKTLTGTAGCIDIVSIYYDGTNYYASISKGFA